MKSKRGLMLRARGEPCLFKHCPNGLFLFEGRVGLKMRTGFGYIEPGELFLGEHPYPHLPDDLAVQPVQHEWEVCLYADKNDA